MRTRIRIGPFTIGRSGIRLSSWRRGTGFSIPFFNRNARSFGKIKLWIFSFYFKGKSKKRKLKKSMPENIREIRKSHKQAYEPWTTETDKKLVYLFRQGKTIKELSEIFGRTNGAIRSRINKLMLQ
jgi:DNA-binding CsgD family transcriptional regulator